MIAHIFILTKLVFFPYPEFFIYPYLTNNGLKPYSQILDQHFPGLMFLPINFDNLGMRDEISARIWLIAIVLITHSLLFFISGKILKSNSKALLVNILYLVWQPFFEGWVFWIDNFLPLLLFPAFYFLNKKKIFLGALFLGTGVVFKQTIIPLTVLVFLYIFWKERVSLFKYLFGLGTPIALMLIYLAYIGVLSDFWYWTVIFNLTVYASSGTQTPKSLGFITRVVVVYGAGLTGFLYKNSRVKLLLLIFLVGSLIGTFDRANFVHFQPSLPFAVLLTALGLYELSKRKLAFVLIGLYLTIAVWWQSIFYRGHISNHIFFFDNSTYDLANKIMEYTKPQEKIFVFGSAPHLYQMSNTLPAGNIFVFQFPWFLKVSEAQIIEGIRSDKPDIIVSDRSVEIEGKKIVDFAKNLDQYIQDNYLKIDQVGNAEILRRKR